MELTRYLRSKRHVTLSEVKNAADFSQFSSLSSLSAFLYPFQCSNGSGSSNRLHKGCRPGSIPVSHDHESSHTRQKLPGRDQRLGQPVISGEIMELHHLKHHLTYITNYNKALHQLDEAISKGDSSSILQLQSSMKFNGRENRSSLLDADIIICVVLFN
ncbi:hypothetical protein PVL29_007783 [Vitis rotundifolia]|uniref:superoxide dismutase n=1 Tax=Vitis rotundifolia TaxID=103349 RepID=A0AA39DVV2_VITRO|nr:hypothetical protein PVL29_007783 [Vitis rotundifolia]